MTTTTNYPLSLEERNSMLQIYSDFYKEAHGFRPRGIDYSLMSDEELVSDFHIFGQICEENAKADEEYQKEAIKAFNVLVQKTIEMGAGDRPTALRWLFEATEDYDTGYFLWCNGIHGGEACRELLKEVDSACELNSTEF